MNVVKEKPLADTALAEWIATRKAQFRDPKTNVPGLSGNRLAKLAGIPQSQISVILKDGLVPKHTTLDKLARFFDANPLMLYRLAYMGDLDPQVANGVLKLEKILEDIPPGARDAYLEALVARAEMLKDAMGYLEKEAVLD